MGIPDEHPSLTVIPEGWVASLKVSATWVLKEMASCATCAPDMTPVFTQTASWMLCSSRRIAPSRLASATGIPSPAREDEAA